MCVSLVIKRWCLLLINNKQGQSNAHVLIMEFIDKIKSDTFVMLAFSCNNSDSPYENGYIR